MWKGFGYDVLRGFNGEFMVADGAWLMEGLVANHQPEWLEYPKHLLGDGYILMYSLWRPTSGHLLRWKPPWAYGTGMEQYQISPWLIELNIPWCYQ